MIEHVRRRVLLCEFIDEVIVATCDEEIKKVVEGAGGKVVMTSPAHERGTDRVAEAARGLGADIVINVQGDEPLLLPWMLQEAVRPLCEDPKLPAVNLVSEIKTEEEFINPDVPKVVANRSGDILYISRSPIPSPSRAVTNHSPRWKQLGIIAFRSDFLQLFTRLEPTPLEKIESVDMMRAIEHGYRVRMVEIDGPMVGVDRPEDIRKVEEVLRKKGEAEDSFLERYR